MIELLTLTHFFDKLYVIHLTHVRISHMFLFVLFCVFSFQPDARSSNTKKKQKNPQVSVAPTSMHLNPIPAHIGLLLEIKNHPRAYALFSRRCSFNKRKTRT